METLRAPIVAVLGHVDHGKTSLLDAVRKTKVAAGEAGGITQSIGASVVETSDKKKITFIDTPGHAAFAKMRARGVGLADIVILVVAANDGPKPQTLESLNAIRETNTPFIVAITKMDLPSANPEAVHGQLEKEGVLFEGRGGQTPSVLVSSKTGEGIEELLQMISLLAEVNGVKADEDADLEAVVIETQKGKGGPQVSLVVRNGKVSVGDLISTDSVSAKVRGILNERGTPVKQILPGEPGLILGFSELPVVGALVKKGEATYHKSHDVVAKSPPTKADVTVYLKAENAGSLEALEASIPEGVAVVGSSVGAVTETDVFMAKAAGAWIFVFQANVPSGVSKLAETEGVNIESYEIIYELLQRLDELIKKGQVQVLGKAQILETFPFNNKKVAGCKVVEGRINKIDKLLLMREDKELGGTKIASIRKQKQEVSEVRAGEEFGVILEPQLDFKAGDMILSVAK